MMRKTLAAVALVWALLTAVPAAALGTQRLLTGYSVSSWAEWNGTPLGAILAIAQDRDGYLWLGGSSGLLRFDGVRFATMETLGLALPGSSVQALLVSPRDGALWVGFAGDGVRVIRNGRVGVSDGARPRSTRACSTSPRMPPAASGRAPTAACSVTGRAPEKTPEERKSTEEGAPETAGGTREERREQRREEHWEEVPLAGETRGEQVFRVQVGRTGHPQGRHPNRHAGEKQPRRLRARRLLEPRRARLQRGRDGRLWVTDPVGGIPSGRRGPPRPARPGRSRLPPLPRFARQPVGRHRGHGLWRVRGVPRAGMPIIEIGTEESGLLSNGIWCVVEDRESNIWVGTDRGLHRLSPHRLTPLAEYGLVRSVEAAAEGGVWVGTATGLIRLAGAPVSVAERVASLGGSDTRP